MMGAVAAVLLKIGQGGIQALQTFIIFTAVPVSIFLVPALWDAPKIAKKLALEQGISKEIAAGGGSKPAGN